MLQELLNALEESLFMIFTSSLSVLLLGFPLSILQVLPNPQHKRSRILIQKCLNSLIPVASSIPYIIILIVTIPFTRFWLEANMRQGSFIAIIPLTIAAFPLLTKVCTEAMNRVPKNLSESALSLGASPYQLVFKVLIPEALPNIILGFSQVLTQVIGLTFVVGILGAGGLGKLLVLKGYQQTELSYILAILLTLVALIMIIQYLARFLAYGNLGSNSRA